jgi:hypothetical protein
MKTKVIDWFEIWQKKNTFFSKNGAFFYISMRLDAR